MDENTWNTHRARLIPTSGINGAEEAENRATSAVLAVISAVSEFASAILKPLGAPTTANIETYIQLPFKLGDQTVIPDGVIRTRRGNTTWTALVEVKTGTNPLLADQVDRYLDLAREQGYDAMVTISNEIPPMPNRHPTIGLRRRSGRQARLVHLPWAEILATAVMQKEFRGVSDPDQAWILGELIRYLEHPRSGALAFEDMGAAWVPVREAVRLGTLRANDKGIAQVTANFDALLRFVGLRLGQRLGSRIEQVLSAKEKTDPDLRSQALIKSLVESHSLSGAIRIPAAAAVLTVTADLLAGQIRCSCEIDAPRTGRGATRVGWLVRQLAAAAAELRLEAVAAYSRGNTAAETLERVRADPRVLVTDPAKEIRSFRLTQTTAMGTRRNVGRNSFIESVLEAVDTFYSTVLQNLRSWTAPAPRLRDEPNTPEIPAPLVSTALSSQDDPEPAILERPRLASSDANPLDSDVPATTESGS